MIRPYRKIALCITEDWFVLSHFIPLIRALITCAAEVVVITRLSGRAGEIEHLGARVVAFDFDRRSTNPIHVAQTSLRLAALLRREAPDAVHLVSLKPIVLGAAAIALARAPAVGIHVTGLGLMAASPSRSLLLSIARSVVKRFHARARTHLFVENDDDLALLLGNAIKREHVSVLGGAGVDPAHFRPMPLAAGPLQLAYVGRLVASKGIDIAIEALRRLRASGHDTRLHLYGKIDGDNPEAVREATVRGWESEGLAIWHGAVTDVREVWVASAIAVVPSLGGEGLPRSLLEAAACGRAIVTTDVPGCRRFVRDGVEGHVVPPGDAPALAVALDKLLQSRQLCAEMGERARLRVADGFTEAAVERDIVAAYQSLSRAKYTRT